MRRQTTSWFLATLGALCGCTSSAGAVLSSSLGEDFRLPVGQSVVVADEALEITFEAVVSDSRCAKGETCVWEGEAIVRLSVKGASGARQKLDLHTSAKGPESAGYDAWSIRLVGLEPYPVTGREIPTAAYVATLQVSRGDPAAIAIQ